MSAQIRDKKDHMRVETSRLGVGPGCLFPLLPHLARAWPSLPVAVVARAWVGARSAAAHAPISPSHPTLCQPLAYNGL